MRKLLTFGALVMASAIFFTNCDKIETSELTLDLTQTATVKATLYADLDLTNLGEEFVPNGTNVIVSIPNSSFNPTATGLWTTNAVVADGEIEVTVPATDDGVTVTFTPAEFTYDQVQGYGGLSTAISGLFKCDVSSLSSVKPGEVRSLTINYNAPTLSTTHAEMFSFNYELTAILKVGDSPTIVKNTPISIYIEDKWSTTATTNDKGLITVGVPIDNTISFRFETSKDMNTTPATSKKHRYEASSYSGSPFSPVVRSVSFGNGTLWE
ncbi:MAG: hypothetical protein PHE03_06505 [Bacteroidales bacterium]|nr:hypothetical protein [Bacteroidales bacterium]MDD3891939.1 hypothetical protein [Bacteroidales bacterium]